MKLQIIHLDPEDDHLSARDKIGWPNASHIILVWPRRGRVLHRRLDLVLLKRIAAQRSFHLGLLTFDPDVQTHAEAVEIPVFESLDEISESEWPEIPVGVIPRRRDRPAVDKPPRASNQPILGTASNLLPLMGRVVPITLGLVSLLLLFVAIVPSAEISLYPETWRKTLQFEILLDSSIQEPQGDGRIPAQRVTLRVEGEDWTTTSGYLMVPSSFATGEVVFTNLTEQSQLIPTGTRIRPSRDAELKFETIRTVRLPGGLDQQISAEIIAVDPGVEGNLDPHQIDSIEGDLGFRVRVDNPSSLIGGGSARVASVSQQDVNELQAAMSSALVDQAIAQLTESLEADQVLTLESVRPVSVVSIESQPEIGQPASQIRVFLELEVEAFVYRNSDLGKEVELLLEQSLPAHSSAIPETTHWEVIESVGEETDELIIRVNADQALYQIQDLRELAGYLPRLNAEAANRFLKNVLPLDAPPVIRLYPSWFPTMPWIRSQIHLHWHWENSE